MVVSEMKANRILNAYAVDFPDIKIGYKTDPPQNLVIAIVSLMVAFVSLFHREYGERYNNDFITVLGGYVLFPSKVKYKVDPKYMPYRVYRALVHEFKHLEQQRDNIFWKARYVLSPLPMFFTERSKWELEAYECSLWCDYKQYGVIHDASIDRCADLFVDYMYGYMHYSRSKIVTQLKNTRRKIYDGEFDLDF